MPIRSLPSHPDLHQLKRQARDWIAGAADRDPRACQHWREHHPRFEGASDADIAAARLTWSDALFAVARSYGFASWPRLKAFVEGPPAGDARPVHHRIADPDFRLAVDLLDDGDAGALADHLAAHPDLVRRRICFEGVNYFGNPSLLGFVAENPVRNDSLPPNIVGIARLILEAGAGDVPGAVDETLSLVASGRVSREAGHQDALIDLLCDHGGRPDVAAQGAMVHGEWDAVDALMRRGGKLTLPIAAGLGRADDVGRLLAGGSSPSDRQRAFAAAVQHGRLESVRLLLESGVDLDAYNPPDQHSHSTALHQAALAGHADIAALLLRHGARRDLKDMLWSGTAADWAEYGGHAALATRLRRVGKA